MANVPERSNHLQVIYHSELEDYGRSVAHNYQYGEQNRKENRELAGSLTHVAPPAEPFFLPSDVIPPAASSTYWGMDWSPYWNGDPDLQVAKDRGCKFVVVKACDGLVPTVHWELNVDRALALGMETWVYFWLYPNGFISGGSQGRTWANLVKYKKLGGWWIDYEWTKVRGALWNPDEKDLEGAAVPFEDAIGAPMTVYSAPAYLREHPLHNTRNRRLAIANYGVLVPLDTPPWPPSGYTLHQRSESADAQEVGFNKYITTAVDLDTLNPAMDPEDVFGDTTPIPPVEPPPSGGTMTTKGVCKQGMNANIKQMVTTSAEVPPQMHPGDYVYGDLNSTTTPTDIINFTHYYLANGTLVDLSRFGKCKVSLTNLIRYDNTPEPGVPPVEPPTSSEEFRVTMTIADSDGTQFKVTGFDAATGEIILTPV